MIKNMMTDTAKSLEVYKQILEILNSYTDIFDNTLIGYHLESIISKGIKVLPIDTRAIEILKQITKNREAIAVKVEMIINGTFDNVGITLRPRYLDNNQDIHVAKWCKDNEISNKIIDLLNFNDSEEGYWCNDKKEQVTLINTKEK